MFRHTYNLQHFEFNLSEVSQEQERVFVESKELEGFLLQDFQMIENGTVKRLVFTKSL